ncbi:DUF5689 domain-containing protein [Parasediminibacterium sp. JCM 36343]|uniref:DUF5689 domain-containing protein n=1 Tax=Parasediminibacterium sp. JCM 36343 TaxID=3374279 RepID=UPI00397E5DA3
MTNKSLIWFGSLLVMLVSSIAIISCNKKFDDPPASLSNAAVIKDPTLETKIISIQALRARHKFSGLEYISDSVVIKGIVTGDDRTGNIYKTIYIQDSSKGAMGWGISLKLDGGSLSVDYPVGRLIYVKCKGLYISDYSGSIQLGLLDNTVPANPSLAGIPSTLFDTYIVKGSLNNPVPVKIVTMKQINDFGKAAGLNLTVDSFQSCVMQIQNAQFGSFDWGLVYADTSAAKKAVSRSLSDCSGVTGTVVYTSGYATFAGVPTPSGNGTIAGIYVPFISNGFSVKYTPELVIRDTADVKFTGIRCDPTPSKITSIADIKAMYNGSDVTLPSTAITGVVISDASNKNISTGNVIIQDATAGIDLYFGTAIPLNVGDSVKVDVSGGKLTSYKGLIEISLSSGAGVNKITVGKKVTPKIITSADFNAQMANPVPLIECTLVTILNATSPSPADNYNNSATNRGNVTLTDAFGKVTLFTSAGALFSSYLMSTAPKSYTGYGTNFNGTAELILRNLNDVK